MRIDLFLKLSRLVARRSVAQDLCDAGAVFLNGSAAKPSKEIKVGDKLEIRRKNRVLNVEVLGVPRGKQISKDLSGTLYSVLADEAVIQEFP